jgi:hypothetical protein
MPKSKQKRPKKKSLRGGRRATSGRKPKDFVSPSALAADEIKTALSAPVPQQIESLAQKHARLAIETFARQLTSGLSEGPRIDAANAVLDRGFGKPGVDAGGQAFLPFMVKSDSAEIADEIRKAARKLAPLAIATLKKIATCSESESARVKAAKSLHDRGLGTVATAKVPDDAYRRPVGKKEERAEKAKVAARGRYQTPSPPARTQH